MTDPILCYRCGTSLAALSLPLSRRDECPACSASLHVCRMCRCFDTSVSDQCREEDAERVRDKETANFCDWFTPAHGVFDAAGKQAADAASAQLDALFGGADVDTQQADDHQAAADALFKS
ncbi:MAG: hypothetical protein AAGA33_05610 [Pseudomonadota bacterium]